MAVEITAPDSSFRRRIRAIEYIEAVYSNASAPLGEGVVTRTPGTAPVAVTGVAATESVETNGQSRIDVSWTGSAGAVSYQVFISYAQPGVGYGDWQAVGVTATIALEFITTLPFGRKLKIAVVAIGELGERLTIANSGQTFLLLLRDDTVDPSVIAEVPGTVANFTLTADTGTLYDLTWDAVADADEYRVCLGTWSSGNAIYEGTGTATTTNLCRLARYYRIKARIGNIWSPVTSRLLSAPVALSGYSTLAASFDSGDFTTGTPENAVRVEAYSYPAVLIQTVPEVPISYLTPTQDVGSVAATHVSLDVLAAPYCKTSADQYLGSQIDVCWFGSLVMEHIAWTLTLERSDDAIAWTSEAITSSMDTDIVRTARYFRARWTASLRDQSPSFDVVAMLQNLRIALYTA